MLADPYPEKRRGLPAVISRGWGGPVFSNLWKRRDGAARGPLPHASRWNLGATNVTLAAWTRGGTSMSSSPEYSCGRTTFPDQNIAHLLVPKFYKFYFFAIFFFFKTGCLFVSHLTQCSCRLAGTGIGWLEGKLSISSISVISMRIEELETDNKIRTPIIKINDHGKEW